MLKRNVGRTDGIIRVVLGALVLVLGIELRSLWGLLGLIPLITGLLGWCPLYLLLGIDTSKGHSDKTSAMSH